MNEYSEILHNSISVAEKVQIQNGVEVGISGIAHHLLAYDNTKISLLLAMIQNFDLFMRRFFNSKYVLNSYSGISLKKDRDNYSVNVHKDVRTFSGDINMMLNSLIMLDDFTVENGATYLLAGSHLKNERPDNDFFFANAKRAVAKKGSIVFWDSKLWHASGTNLTDHKRECITFMFSRPFLKPAFDYINLFESSEIKKMSEELRQVLGYYSRIPRTLEDFYQPKDSRFYRFDQEMELNHKL